MPIYEYECPQCGVFEQLVSHGTDSVKCTNCGRLSLKIMSLSSFALKGTGWYATDYKTKPSNESKKCTTNT